MAQKKDKELAAWLAAGGSPWAYRCPLTDDAVAALPPPAAGKKIKYDSAIKGFGVSVWASGARSFVLNYRVRGRERRYTIGSYPDWPTETARNEAASLKRRIDRGEDPMAERHAERVAPTVDDLADRFEREHLPKKRARTQNDYLGLLRLYIRPELGRIRVADLRHGDVEKLHHALAARAPYAANRCVAVVSRMLSLAIRWEMCDSNVARGIERAHEEKRTRYLTLPEIARLSEALANHPEKISANVVRLLLLTGARKGETLAARWADFDLSTGVWVKPSAHTKQKSEHRVPLSPPALALLAGMKAEADRENARRANDGLPAIEWVFPSVGAQPLGDIKHFWATVCRKAGLGEWVPKTDARGRVVTDVNGRPVKAWKGAVRVHDIRHTYASILASSGLSLPIIGALLGHTQAATTLRYAHLLDSPLRRATERAGAIISAAGGDASQEAEVVEHPARRR